MALHTASITVNQNTRTQNIIIMMTTHCPHLPRDGWSDLSPDWSCHETCREAEVRSNCDNISDNDDVDESDDESYDESDYERYDQSDKGSDSENYDDDDLSDGSDDADLDSNLRRCLMTRTMVVVTQPRTRITATMTPIRMTTTVSPPPASAPSLSPCRLWNIKSQMSKKQDQVF